MTTLTLTIGGANFLPQYKKDSARITENLANQGNRCEMVITQKSGQTAPSTGKEIIFKDGSRFLFGGYITRVTPEEYGVGQLIRYRVEAVDYTYVLINKAAQESYSSMTLGAIVADLLSTYVHAGYGITGTAVATGPTITTINFNHISLRQCFENLSKLTGFIWWIDYAKDVHFIDPGAGASAPEAFRDSPSTNHESVSINVDLSQVRNDVVILGGTAESSNYPQVILGDGNAREWVLVYPVSTMVSVELDTGAGYVSKTFGVDPKDDPTAYDFMYSPTRGSIRCGTAATPGATHKLRVTFKYPFPVVTEVQDAASIAALAALEGGDGIHAYTITDPTIVSTAQASARGLKELDAYSNPILSGVIRTRTGLLSAGSYFSAGQRLTVNLPAWGISTDTNYTIQKVVTTITSNDSQIEYHYEITFGGRLLGVVDFLIALATVENPLDTAGEVETIHAVSAILSIAEVIARDDNLKTVTDTLTLVETAPSRITQTPPFQWKPGGANPLQWNKGEWG